MIVNEIWLFKFPIRALLFSLLTIIFLLAWKRYKEKIKLFKWLAILLCFFLINLLPNNYPPVYDTYYHFQNSVELIGNSKFTLDHYHTEWPGFFLIGGLICKLLNLNPIEYLKIFYYTSGIIFLIALFDFIFALSMIIYIKKEYVPIIFILSVVINSWIQIHYSPQSFATILALIFFANIVKDIRCEKKDKKAHLIVNTLILIILIPSHPPTLIFLSLFYAVYYIITRIFYYENIIYTKINIAPLFALLLWIIWLIVFGKKTLLIIKESFFRIDISNIKYFLSGNFHTELMVFDFLRNILIFFIVFISIWQILTIIKRYKTYKINYEIFLSSYSLVFLISFIMILLLNINFSDRPLFYLSFIIPLILFKEYRILSKVMKKIILFIFVAIFILGLIFFHKNYYPNLISRDEIEAGMLMNYTAEESVFLFHPHNHFKKINGHYYFSENSKYWHTKEEFDFRKKLLKRKKVFYSQGIVKIYSD